MCFCRRVHWCPYWEVDGWLMLVAVGCCCPWHKMVYLQLKPLQNTGSQTLESRSCGAGVMGWWGDDCRSLGQTPGACSHVEQFLSFRTHPMADKNLNLYIYIYISKSFFTYLRGQPPKEHHFLSIIESRSTQKTAAQTRRSKCPFLQLHDAAWLCTGVSNEILCSITKDTSIQCPQQKAHKPTWGFVFFFRRK